MNETKKYRLSLVAMILAALLSVEANAQWPLMHTRADSLIKQGTYYIYNVKFDSARKCFDQVISEFPDHPAGYFLNAMIEWQKIRLFRETTKYDKAFLKKINKVVKICDKRLEENPSDIKALFFQGGAYGYRGRYHAKRKNYLDVVNDGKKGYKILKQCLSLAPGNHDIMLGTGLYNYFAEAFPEKYPLLKTLAVFFPKGDKRLGILQLKSAAKNAKYAYTEAKDVLLQIYYQFEEDYVKALDIAEELHGQYPDNPYYHRYLGRCYIVRGLRYQSQAESEWRLILKRCIKHKTGYDRMTAREALFYIGFCEMRNRNRESAIKYYERCVRLSERIDKKEPSGFLIKAKLYAGKMYDLIGEREKAVEKYKNLLEMRDYKGSREDAQRYLKNAYGS